MLPEATLAQPSLSGLLELAASCDVGNVDRASSDVVNRARERGGGYVCFCNVHLLTLAVRDLEVGNALDRAWKRMPDGAPVAWLQRRLGRADARRIGGPDLMPRVVDLGRTSRLKHFLLGSTPAVLARLEGNLVDRFPGAEIVGRYSPPFGAGAEAEEVAFDEIRSVQPHLAWCALGAPKQELWMMRASPAIPDVLLLGVGAAFDFLADSKPRAPRWMREHGLEWMHRLATEPRRLGGRYVRTNTEFIVRSGLELSSRRRRA